MSTIIKTGCILACHYNEDKPKRLYGDLHMVGNCAVFYYPYVQAPWQDSEPHGFLAYVGNNDFQRDTDPFHVLVVPASRISMKREALHPTGLCKWIEGAGGLSR